MFLPCQRTRERVSLLIEKREEDRQRSVFREPPSPKREPLPPYRESGPETAVPPVRRTAPRRMPSLEIIPCSDAALAHVREAPGLGHRGEPIETGTGRTGLAEFSRSAHPGYELCPVSGLGAVLRTGRGTEVNSSCPLADHTSLLRGNGRGTARTASQELRRTYSTPTIPRMKSESG